MSKAALKREKWKRELGVGTMLREGLKGRVVVFPPNTLGPNYILNGFVVYHEGIRYMVCVAEAPENSFDEPIGVLDA